MISGLSKFKWVVLFLFIPMAGIAANANGFVLQLKGPEVHTPSSPGNYGPIVKADTLWSVATATRPNNSVSLYKMMAAILALNPHAFLDGDINKMVDGSFLKIPNAAEIQATDGSKLKLLLTKKSDAQVKSTSASKPTTSNLKVITKNKPDRDKLSLLQGELTESNDHLLLSTETNRRLKLQLESIRMELAELKEQMAIDNQLKADLRALIEQQNAQIIEQQTVIKDAKEQAILDAKSHNNWWIIGGVSGLFSLLSIVWLGLWLKNRNDKKNNLEDGIMFETDNSDDELSDYLSTESFTGATNDYTDGSETVQSPMEQPNEINPFTAPDLDEPNFNLPMETELADVVNYAPAAVVTQSSAPIMPEVIEQAPVMPELSLGTNDFSDIDLTLDYESTSFENDSVTPDLSWREELDEPSLLPEPAVQKVNTLDEDLAEVDSLLEQFKLGESQAPDTEAFNVNSRDDANVTATRSLEVAPESSPVVNDEFVNMDDIDSILAEAELETTTQMQNEVVDMDDIDSLLAENVTANLDGQQTVDEMLAELDNTAKLDHETATKSEGNDSQLDDIEAMLAAYSPNAFSAAPSEQAPIDVVAAKKEEFIDIDKLLNEASQAPANIEDEPYDQVKLDVGLDGYSNRLLKRNVVDIDDESNRVNAQLDLARAYLEIEDKDGAKSILEPLAGTGDATQQAEVNNLLSRL